MEKNKNILIGGLLAIVLVMAVGYAAFATQLTINGTANVTSSWNVHYDTTYTSGITKHAGTEVASSASDTQISGSISPITNSDATLTAKLVQPGDYVTFTLKIVNDGNLSATAGTPTLECTGGTVNGLTATKGHIKFTVTAPSPAVLAAQNNGDTDEATMTVKAEFLNTADTTYTYTDSNSQSATTDVTTLSNNVETASLTVHINYTQTVQAQS